MIAKPKVRIAGAGALGLAIALELAEAGCRVEVFDPATLNASSVAAGMLAPAFECVLDPVSRDHFPLLLAARDLWPARALRSGVVLDRSGALWAGQASDAERHFETLQRLGVSLRLLGGPELAHLAPGLGADETSGVFVEDDWRLDPAQAIGALRQAAIDAGVVFHDAPAPRSVDELLVIATGAGRDLAALAPELSHLAPIKGHILRFAGPATFLPVVRGEGVYAVPSAHGLVVGATMEPGIAHLAVDPAKAQALAEAGARLFPALSGRDYDASVGVRAATPDGLPMVGFGSRADVLLAVGARRNGWLLAPLVAKLIRDLVIGDDPGAVADRLSPRRFVSAI